MLMTMMGIKVMSDLGLDRRSSRRAQLFFEIKVGVLGDTLDRDRVVYDMRDIAPRCRQAFSIASHSSTDLIKLFFIKCLFRKTQ